MCKGWNGNDVQSCAVQRRDERQWDGTEGKRIHFGDVHKTTYLSPRGSGPESSFVSSIRVGSLCAVSEKAQ